MLQEFRKFAMRGNVIDLAVGVIIGMAFGRIVASLVNDILMPVLGIIVGGIDISGLRIVIRQAQGEAAELAISYGAFLQSVIDFAIIAFSVFLIVRWVVSLQRKRAEEPAPPPPTPPEQVLLTEIRDLLKARTG